MSNSDVILFSLEPEFGRGVAAALGVPLAAHEERDFEDGEHKMRPLENVRGRDVYVICTLYGDARHSVSDKLVRLLFFLGALRDASAGRLTAVVPYLCYARKDRKTKARDPVATRYVAGLFESVGTDRVLTLDVHNPAAYENAFRIHAEHLDARKLFADYFISLIEAGEVVVVSPDPGGIKRAEAFRQILEKRLARSVGRAFMEKRRSEGVVSGEVLVGEVAGKTAIIIDDIVNSGMTLVRAAAACRKLGAGRIYAAASHGLFSANAGAVLADAAVDRLVVTNSVPGVRLQSDAVGGRLEVLDVAPLFAEAIRRLHGGGSLVELLED